MRLFAALAASVTFVAISCVLPDDFKSVDGAGGNGASGGTDGPGGTGGTGGTGGAETTGGAGGVGGAGGTSGPGGAGGQGCIPNNDAFGGTSLDVWTVAPNITGVDHSVMGGELSVSVTNTTPNYAWYNSDRGWFAYQTACGDFAAVVEVAVSNYAGSGVPAYDFNNAGLLVRDPTQPTNNEFWALVTIGVQDAVSQRGETKATQHSVSDVTSHDLVGGPALAGRVGICRVGTQIRLSAAPFGGSWETLATFGEFMSGAPDGEVSLPPTVEVGLVANAWQDQDLEATFDNAEFWVPDTLDDCVSD